MFLPVCMCGYILISRESSDSSDMNCMYVCACVDEAEKKSERGISGAFFSVGGH